MSLFYSINFLLLLITHLYQLAYIYACILLHFYIKSVDLALYYNPFAFYFCDIYIHKEVEITHLGCIHICCEQPSVVVLHHKSCPQSLQLNVMRECTYYEMLNHTHTLKFKVITNYLEARLTFYL